MRTSSFRLRCLRTLAALGWLLCFNASARQGLVTVQARTVTTHIRAYARVVPISETKLRAAMPGVVQGITILPGSTVKGGAVLGHLKGPGIEALLVQRRGAVAGDRAALRAANRSLASERQKRASHLSTSQSVSDAEAAVSQAKAKFSAAQARLAATEEQTVLRAPVTGTVLSIAIGNGERVGAGQAILTVQPPDRLWIEAFYYGTDFGTIHPGMTGSFVPADGGATIPVRVISVLARIDPGGGLPIGLRPTAKNAALPRGQNGTVILDGKPRKGVAVPTGALILDRGRWWVLVRVGQRDRRQAVSPVTRMDGETLVGQGLSAGMRVVVGNAYLRFHRDVARQYQPPD